MNFMRKMVGQGTTVPTQDMTLGLTHLRKLFSDFRQSQPGSSQKDLEDKLYNMLPLFCKVFGSVPVTEMTDKFGDILQFCSHVSRLMFNEIRRRASNQSTEAASYSIVKFLEIENTEESSNGWMLLSSINLLSVGPPSLIDCMTAASLPSTLVKCLYLFFDLPCVEHPDVLVPGSEFTPNERRVLLQKVFVQVLVRLCSHTAPAEELARKDDLTLLFSAITSWCPNHNVPWRKSAAEVLMTLSRHGLTPNVVQYIHNKGCVTLCVDNMQRVQELSPIELVEMFVTVFCFLKDSSEVSQILLDDFRSCQGYVFLTDFLLRMEKDHMEESIQALRNLVLLVGSLTTCGFIELKPGTAASSGSLFKLPGFTVPQPCGKGVSVRNLQAFQVLQTVFLKGTSSHLCSTILDVISSIYHQDSANYFILEPQNTLAQFAEKLHLKPDAIQNKFFEVLEFVVFNLNFIPCKELISISILIKSNHSLACSKLCMQGLMRILHHHPIFKDVFREVGILEVMVTCLHRFAALLKEPTSGEALSIEKIPAEEIEMGNLVMDGLVQVLSANNNNASVFRECGGARCAHNMVPYPVCRQQALTIVQQLVLSQGGDDDMGTLLGLMHTAPPTELTLKTHILKSLLSVLRESHRTRTVFRKVGGFVYVMSVLVSMEGCLANPPKSPWNTAASSEISTLLRMVFSTLSVAMRYEPANARFFATEVRYSSLTEAVRLLGCFSSQTFIKPMSESLKPRIEPSFSEAFFQGTDNKISNVPPRLISACEMLRHLYDMALDMFEKPAIQPVDCGTSPNNKRLITIHDNSMGKPDMIQPQSFSQKRPSTGSLDLPLNNSGSSSMPDSVIVHAGAVISMLHLVPAISCEKTQQLALDLQWYTCDLLKSLLRSEHNQQIMCEAGLPHELLSNCFVGLSDETSPLHPPLQYIFERQAAQSLQPKDLRDFLRLGNPLCCAAEDEESYDIKRQMDANSAGPTFAVDKPINLGDKRANNDINKKLKSNGGAVPLTRVKCLVSMTTPRDVRLHGASITPAFVEFDMTSEGFGCLYLPSIAPQGPPNPGVVSATMISGPEPGVVGGIGSGERLFPPQSGFTFSSWLCVDKFCGNLDAHPVRLLTIVRQIQGRDDGSMCLSVFLAPRDRALIVSTHESSMPTSGMSQQIHLSCDDEGSADLELEPIENDTTVRFWCPDLTQEGQWRHLVLIFHRAGIMKNSSVSLFVDGALVNTKKLHYISPNLGSGGTGSATSTTSIYAYIGTPPQQRHVSRLVWRQGPCHLVEDIVQSSTVQQVYKLGPNYVGSFQAPNAEGIELSSPLIPEDKIVFGIHAHAMSLMTIAKIRKVYNKVDSKSVAKQLGMSHHENATPIRILHNSAAHLSGPARSFGAILMGYLGVRTFCPKPVAKMLLNVGGCHALLGLVAMATDVEGLYASVKALVCTVKSNKQAQKEMLRVRGYQTLAMLLKKKRHLLNSHILHLTFSLVGTVDSGRESTVIPNKTAFEDLLCDLEVWHEAPGDLQRSLYEHFFELLTESSEQKTNLKLMLDLGLVTKLLHVLRDTSLSRSTLQTIAGVLVVLLGGSYHPPTLLKMGQFMVSLIPSQSINEKSISLEESSDSAEAKQNGTETSVSMDTSTLVYNIKLRNSCLDMILTLVTSPPVIGGINVQAVEELQKTLGFDWLMLFLQRHLHSSTVVATVRLLLLMQRSLPMLQKFRDGSSNGGWLRETEDMLKNKEGTLLGFHVGGAGSRTDHHEVNREICHVTGFQQLQWLLPKHAEISQLYFLLMALLLGQPVKKPPTKIQFDLDSIWTFIFGVPASQPAPNSQRKLDLCTEAAVVILGMVRAMLNQSWETEAEGCWLREYPVTLLQFLLYLYHNQPDFMPICMNGDFICALVATMFPYRNQSQTNSEIVTPQEDFKPFPGAESVVLVKTTERSNSSSTLSSHPARKHVTDFLKHILTDSLSLSQSSKSPAVIDLILEASPEHASRSQRREYQTCVMKMMMDYLADADVLLGDQAALRILTSGSHGNTTNNVFYFAGRVVDKLWQGSYIREPKEVFEFICNLISQAKRKASGTSLDGIYKCLNRTILFQLSRPLYTVTDMMAVVYALHKLTEHRSLVFGPGNYDQEFLGCLCYCLLQLTEDPSSISPNSLRTTTWHVECDNSDSEETGTPPRLERENSQEGQQLLGQAAKRVWEELYVCKKPAIEDIFKVTLTNPDTGATANVNIDLLTVRPQIQEAASKVWVNYFENERKCVYNQTEKIHSQIQSKLQKVGHGVLKLATRKVKKESSVKVVYTTAQEFITWTTIHISIVRDLAECHYQQYLQSFKNMDKYLVEEWSGVESELMRERGLWGPPVGSELDKWLLDITEGPNRMRKKMVKNDMFYLKYPYRPEKQDGKDRTLKYKMATSLDSRRFYERYRSHSLVGEDNNLLGLSTEEMQELNQSLQNNDIGDTENAFSEEMPLNTPSLLPCLPRDLHVAPSLDNEDDPDLDSSMSQEGATDTQSEQPPESRTDNQALLRLLEEGDKISHMFRCARIQGLDTVEGLLLYGKEHFYIIDGFTLLKSKEIADIDSLPADLHEPIIPPSSRGPVNLQKKKCFKLSYEDIREVHKRRYLLQPMALEVFSADGRNFLLAFPKKEIRNKVLGRFLTVATAIADSAHESVSGQKLGAKIEPGTGLIHSLIGEKSVTERWQRGEISNFEYLMCLNTLAGRSYNDLMQYPVFPWIVADYESPELDLTEPSTFRDLSKPMGAQTPDRLKQYQKRYNDWEDPQGETPAYHYGTHYSSAMIVASYLVRMEPFTQHFLRLQGGHFDLADRMFHSVKDAWFSASKHNMADVKELIPEFFYLPEFLTNSNNFDLGTKQSGVSLGDVVLPAWAKSDPREFIRAHREALECDYVSSHLHEWIDLIFGAKQQGPSAVETVNVFHYLFYEGNVDINSITDPLQKNAIIGFINNFGQIPKQLFKRAHPQKKLNIKHLFFHSLENLQPSKTPVKEVKSAVGQICHHDNKVLAVEQNKVLIPPQYSKYLAWGFSDMSVRIGNYDSDKAVCVFENLDNGEILCAACPNSKIVITAGTSTVVSVWEYGKGRERKQMILKGPLYGHIEPVTCLAASGAYNIVVSGSRDRTCIVWDLSRLAFVRQLRGHAAPVAAVCINDVTGDIATCAGTYLHVWSINGDELASINTATARNQQIMCVSMSQLMEWDSSNVILTGSSDGVVRMWSLEFVEVADESLMKSIQQSASSSRINSPENSQDKVDGTTRVLAEFKDPENLVAKQFQSSATEEYRYNRTGDLITFTDNGEEEDMDGQDTNATAVKEPSIDSCIEALDSVSLHSVQGQNQSGKQHEAAPDAVFVNSPTTVVSSQDITDSNNSDNTGDRMPNASSEFDMVTSKEVSSAIKSERNSALMALGRNPGQSRKLREGFRWQKQLVFRYKLTSHTAFERKDNKDPAPVTAIAVSKDHKIVYVGDAKGRIWSWTVSDTPSKFVDHWMRDEGTDCCTACRTKFSITERRHHCRNCGQLFCSKCSRYETEIHRLRITKPVRVCQACHTLIQANQAAESMRLASV